MVQRARHMLRGPYRDGAPLCSGTSGRADATSGGTCSTGVLLGVRGENVMCRYVPRTACQDPGKGAVPKPEKTSSSPFHLALSPGAFPAANSAQGSSATAQR